jgi:hypothetical protein
LGLAGSIYYLLSWRMSAEHRRVLAKKAAAISARDAKLAAGDLPGVPKDAALTDSPGTRLAYRLPVKKSGGWALATLVAAVLVLIMMASVFLALAFLKAWEGEWGDFGLLILAGLLFAAPSVWLVRHCVRQLNYLAHFGRTVVEISQHPLHPGDTCRVFLAQFGRLQLERLRLALVCEERATYHQGTNTRSESREVVEQEVYAAEGLTVAPERPLELEAELIVPRAAMHSFRSPSNEIAWMLVVEAAPKTWPAFRRTFPVIIHPDHGDAS